MSACQRVRRGRCWCASYFRGEYSTKLKTNALVLLFLPYNFLHSLAHEEAKIDDVVEGAVRSKKRSKKRKIDPPEDEDQFVGSPPKNAKKPSGSDCLSLDTLFRTKVDQRVVLNWLNSPDLMCRKERTLKMKTASFLGPLSNANRVLKAVLTRFHLHVLFCINLNCLITCCLPICFACFCILVLIYFLFFV